MPFNESRTNPLLMLADVALGYDFGFDSQPGQQSALSPFSAFSPEVVTTQSTAPAEQSSNLVSREGDVTGNYSSRGQKQQRRSTQSANLVTATNSFSPMQQQQPAPSQSFTAVNRTQKQGDFTPINPRPQPRNRPAPEVPAPEVPNPKHKAPRQKTKPRTNGFNRRTGENGLTPVCGIITPFIATPVAKENKKGAFCCPRCLGQFTRPRTVKDHFRTCATKHGNPRGLRWFDHPTLIRSQNHVVKKMTTIREEKEAEEEESDRQDDGDQEQDHGDDEDLEAYREKYGEEPDQEHDHGDEDLEEYGDGYGNDLSQDQDHGQEDQNEYDNDGYDYNDESMFEEDWESSPGEDDQGRDTSASA